ncbi:MAG: DUF2878 domain-containing protein [Lysobacteraceae bacterium]
MKPAVIANAIGYQLVWFGAIASAAMGYRFVGAILGLAFVALVLRFGGKARQDAWLLLPALLIGFTVDGLWAGLGWIDYHASWPSSQFAPMWILGIWIAFAMTLNHSLAFLREHLAFASMVGAIGGPLAYLGAANGFHAIEFTAPLPLVLCGLGVVWAVMVPILVLLAERHRSPAVHQAVP